ncbi:sulfotransferase domain-containing protein [Mesorhizobium sp. B2-4-10]|uniref:sulfotransferase domain-containing protein n=1 Tax=Mesorhizobium sp. B2-4-10 TaxID=2589939 RepID=UPI0011273224|nr:sulfotransferase domain-containing protein [Mesorhizobium sp. B2-4-10]TPL14109.1 sulfotransferase domain-containing protein [Mesorhizobium sp. B2-4-10]
MLTTTRLTLHKIDARIRMTWAASGADAFLVSYPESGVTQLRHILSEYFRRHANGENVHLSPMFEVLPDFDLDPTRGIPAFRYTDERHRVPLVLVSHLTYRRSLFLNRPIIFMTRDPRDVIVSAYFDATRHKRCFEGTMDAFIADREQGLPALIVYLNDWGRGLKHHVSAVLGYGELTEDPMGACTRILRFLGHTPSVRALQDSIDASRFDVMREHEMAGGLAAHDGESQHARPGKVGGFSDHLSDAQAELIEQTCIDWLTPAAIELLARGGTRLACGWYELRRQFMDEHGQGETIKRDLPVVESLSTNPCSNLAEIAEKYGNNPSTS